MNSQAQEDICTLVRLAAEVSAIVLGIVPHEGGRGGGQSAARSFRRCTGIVRREGKSGGRVWLGGASHGARADAARGGGSFGTRADAGEAGRAHKVSAGARVPSSITIDVMMMAVSVLSGLCRERERSWLLPRKLVLFLLYNLFCMCSLPTGI